MVRHADAALSNRRRILAIGQTKVDGWHLASNAIDLFRDEYKLPLIDPTIAAYLSVFAEHFFLVLLALGLATRFPAMSLSS